MLIGRRCGTTAVWAECKDTEGGVTRAHIGILKHAVDDVRKRKIGWKPTHVYVVTSNRLDQDAHHLAVAYGFECYVQIADGFRPVDPPVC
jgi:hypothetical protein